MATSFDGNNVDVIHNKLNDVTHQNIKKWPSCADLPRAQIAFGSVPSRPATLGVPLTRSLSISGPANLADTLGLHAPAWTHYYYRSPSYRSGLPYRLWADRFMCDRILYDKHYSVQPIYRNVPIQVPYHRTNFSNRQRVGYWSFDYDYMHELSPKPLFSVFDPFDDKYRHWNKYGSKRLDEPLNQHCYYFNKRHYFF